MSDRIQAKHAYLLVDGALASEALTRLPSDVMTGKWLHPMYVGEGRLLGPLLIDVDAVREAEQFDEMMNLVNAASPQLHLSYIETVLSTTELRSHLQQFNVIRSDDGRLFNLRLSDCVVLAMLAEVLSSAQWATLTGPLLRWSVHGRDGKPFELGVVASEPLLRPPLTFSETQFARLAELGAPDVVLANIRHIRHGGPLVGSSSEQHRWASEARQRWCAAANSDEIVLRWITAAAVDTRGAFLSRPDLAQLLAEGDRERIKSAIASAQGSR